MTREDIIRMALEAGFEAEVGDVWISEGYWADELELFAALVAAAEREKFTIHAAALVRDARQDAIERERDRQAFELAESYRCGWDGGVQAEREACAKTAEAHIEEWTDDRPKYALYECAAAIRERDKK